MQNAHQGSHEDSHESAHSKLHSAHDLMYTNVGSIFTCSIFNFSVSLRIFLGYFKPVGLFPFCKVIFGDPPKIPFKTSIK